MSFVLDLTRFAQRTNTDMRQVVRKLAFESFKRIILRTPVDTGRARANWGVTIGSPRSGAFNTEAVDKSGSRTLETARSQAEHFDCQGSIFMTNNLPYIGALEYGSSKQAPSGMVRVTVAEMRGFITKARIGDLKRATSK